MSFSQQLSNYLLGNWITQQTTYNLISNTVNNIKMYKILKEYTIKTLSSESKELHINKILRRYFNMVFLSKDRKYNMYLKYLEKKTKQTEILLLFNHQNNIYLKKFCNLSKNSFLYIYTQYSRFYILEKLWFVNQNLVLSVNLVFIDRYVALIIFESKIRISKQ